MTSYPPDELYREMAFLAYYLHWQPDVLLGMDHAERRRWCKEVSEINKQLDADNDNGTPLQGLR